MRQGIMWHVLPFIRDPVPYILKDGQGLSVVYSKMTHFIYVTYFIGGRSDKGVLL